MENVMSDLEGRTIESIWIDQTTQEYLRFETDQGPLCYIAVGDCCSETWFADLLGIDALLGQTVRKAEFVSLGEPEENDNRTRQEYDWIYSYKLFTDRGIADIIFRNSSNGYYSGWLSQSNCQGDIQWAKIMNDYSA